MDFNLNNLKINTDKEIYRNLSYAELVSHAIKNEEGILANSGAFVVKTGKYTGRSPKDRFIVRQESVNDLINWGEVNLPIEEEIFNNLYSQVIDYLSTKNLYVFDGYVGAMKEYSMNIRVVNELASQALMSNQLFRRYEKEQLESFKPEFNVIVAPGFREY